MKIRNQHRRHLMTTGRKGTHLLPTLEPLPDPVKVEREARRAAKRLQGVADIEAEIATKALKRHRYRPTPTGVCSDCLQAYETLTTITKHVSGGDYRYEVPLHTGITSRP